MKYVKASKYHVPDGWAETMYGQPGATLLPIAALGICRQSYMPVGAPEIKGMTHISVIGSAFVPYDLTGGDDYRQLWYGKVLLLPETKFRKGTAGLQGLRADQFLCTNFAHPSRWEEQIFGEKMKLETPHD